MAAPPPELLADLPPAVAEAYGRLFPKGDPGPPAQLRAQIQRHLDETTRAAKANEFVDATLSHTLAERLLEVVRDWDRLTPTQRAATHAAVAYYALSDDAEDDLDSVLGFEDDARVVNACLRFVGRPQRQVAVE